MTGRKLRILDFDLENRPLTYLGGDYTTGDITAIAWGWGLGEPITCRALGETEQFDILYEFVEAYNLADIVTGHFIRGYDLPVINGALLENGLPPLSPKMSSDTKLDLKKSKYQSLSQENLGAMLGTSQQKVQMTQTDWREANRLTERGIAKTKKRVIADVRQHQQLRVLLVELGWLGPPKRWSPQAKGSAYRP